MTDAVTYNRTRRFFPRDTWAMIQIAIGAEADGIPGKATAAALKAYQEINGLTPDGKFGAMTQTHFADLWHEERLLTIEEACILMEPTARHESGSKGYAAQNRDGEFKGWWDRPDDDPPYFHTYSHRGSNPLHVGVSWLRIQEIQTNGNTGRALALGRQYAEASGCLHEWYEATDGRGDELLEVLTRSPGERKVRIKGDIGRRTACTMPIDGKDAWEQPWTDRLTRLSQYNWMQRAADDRAYQAHFKPMIKDIVRTGWTDGGSIACLFDACVNHGHAGMRRRLNKVNPETQNIFHFIRQFGTSGKLYRRRVMAHDRSPWWITYTINGE